MKVSEAVADALAVEADGPIFGLMGDANMAVWDALVKDGRSRVIWSRHDGAAVLMTDGYAKATGRLGVCTVTCGPGLANCANALITAARAQTPMVIFTGHYVDDGGKAGLQAMDQRRFAQACECEYRLISNLDSMAEDIAEGFYTARTKNCPVVLDMPSALWDAELHWDWDYKPSTGFVPYRAYPPSTEALQMLADRLRQARNPVIIAGRGAVMAGAHEAIERLGDMTGALLATSLLAKGYFRGNPWEIGVSGSFSSAPTEQLMARADFVLGLGASLNFYTSEGGMLFPNAQVVRVDVKPFPPTIGNSPGHYFQGDALKTAEALTKILSGSALSEGFRTAETRAVLQMPTETPPAPTDGLDPRELMRCLSAALPDGTQVVSGGGHFWSWPVAHLMLPAGGRFQHSVAFGSIGLGLAHGIGAAAGRPDLFTLVVEGDGSFLQAIQELHAAAEQGIRLAVLIMNDSGYGAEVLKLKWKNRDPRNASWNSPDFVTVAKSFGGDGVRLGAEADITDAIVRAMQSKGPFVIDARISPTEVSDSYGRLFLGQQNRIPLLRSSATHQA